MSTNVFLCALFQLSLFLVISCGDDSVSVRLSGGQVLGRRETVDDKALNVFLGIPYAQPPVDRLRFQKPLPIESWSEPIEAVNWPRPCYQANHFLDNFRNQEFSEDCLYLNIWSPTDTNETAASEGRAVMFWIHGGALIIGSSVEKFYSGHVLAAKGDVVVVTINYRVNTFGFLYTGTDDAPGNMGLWDQAMALEWVKDNIRYFGGDSNRITVFGESAGSWSTSLHILSPITRNLFQNAIMMSGGSINRMAGDEPDNVRNGWLKGAHAIGCTDEQNSKEFTPAVIDCLKKAPADKLALIPMLPEVVPNLYGWMSMVVIDKTFLPDRPLKMLESGDYKKHFNLLVGTAEDEGSFVLQFIVDPVTYGRVNPPNITYEEAYSQLSRIASNLVSKEPIDGQQAARLYFTGLSDQSGSDLLRRTVGIAVGDFLLGCPCIQFGKTVYNNDPNSKVYQYHYTSKLGEPKLLCSKWMGACHFDDVYPTFGVPFYQHDDFVEQERQISEQVIKIFSTFAKTGRPEPQRGAKWPHYYKVNGNTIAPYLEITHRPRDTTDFGLGLKINECEYLWKKYIDQQ